MPCEIVDFTQQSVQLIEVGHDTNAEPRECGCEFDRLPVPRAMIDY